MGVVAAVIVIVIIGMLIAGIVFYHVYKKRSHDIHTNTLQDTAKQMEEASMAATAVTIAQLHDKIDHTIEIIEETNTGVNSLGKLC